MLSLVVTKRAREDEQHQAEEARDYEEDTVAGLGDGCSYKITRSWFQRIGINYIDAVCKVLSSGGASHLSIIDDGDVVRVEFFSYIVHLDREVKKGLLTRTLHSALFEGRGQEKHRCHAIWGRLQQSTRGDVMVAAMKLGLLRGTGLRTLAGEDDAAEIWMNFSSRRARWMAEHPQAAFIQLDEALKRVCEMKRSGS